MSEMVMFTPKKVINIQDTTKVKTYYSKYSFAASGELKILDKSKLDRYAENKFAKENETGSAFNSSTYSLSLNSIALIDSVSEFGFNVAMFPTLGIDVTIQLTQNEYLTFGATVYGGQQVILQRRLIYSQQVALAIGLFYDRTYQGYDVDIDCGFCSLSPEEVFYLNVFGLRGIGFVHDGQKNRAFMKFNFKTGYIANYGDFYSAIGFSFGMF